jgi:hypothetical protein
MLPVAAIIGALLYRLRGGWLKDLVAPFKIGTQVSRLVWAIPTACLMTEMAHAPWWIALPMTVSNFAAIALFGTGQYLQDVSLRRTPDWLGLARNSLAAVPIVLYSLPMFAAYAIVGAAHSTLYWLGHRTGYDSRAGECIVGAVSWSVIVLCR